MITSGASPSMPAAARPSGPSAMTSAPSGRSTTNRPSATRRAVTSRGSSIGFEAIRFAKV